MRNRLEMLVGETQARLVGLLRRSRRTINELADGLKLTDNAVRNHVAALSRDGIVEDVGTERDTGGKPARVYALTKEGEELYPKAYALVLNELIAVLNGEGGAEHSKKLLRSVGKRIADQTDARGNKESRVQAAAAVLKSVGGELDVLRTDEGWRLQGYGCPLSAITSKHDEACAMATALVEGITGDDSRVTECCDRGDRPRCAFNIV